MTEPVEVKLGVDTGNVKVQFEQTAAAVAASLNRMADALKDFTEHNKKTREQSERDTQAIAKSFGDMKDKLSSHFDKISALVEKAKGAIAALTTAAAGGMLFKDAVQGTLHFQDSVEQLERVLGVSSQRATELAIALKLSGKTSDDYAGIVLHVGRMLKNNSEEFDRLKIKIRDTNGALLPMEEVLQNVYRRMQDFKVGTDQNLFTLTAVGRGAKDFAETMERLEMAQARATEMARQFGIAMGPAEQEKIKEYRIEFNAFLETLSLIGVRITMDLLPRLQALSKWMSDEGPAAASVITKALMGVAAALSVVGHTAYEALLKLKGFAQQGSVDLIALAGTVSAAARGKYSEIPDIIAAAWKVSGDKMKSVDQQILDDQKDLVNRIKELWDGISRGKPPGAPAEPMDQAERRWASLEAAKRRLSSVTGGTEEFKIKPTGAGADQSVMAALEAQLKVKRDTIEREKLLQGSFEQWSVQDDRDYWQNLKDNATQLGEKDRLAILEKYYDAERKVRQQAFQGEIAGLYASLENFKYDYDERVRIAQDAYAKIATAFGVSSAQAQEAARKVAEQENAKAQAVARRGEIQARLEEAQAQHQYAMGKLAMDQDLAMRRITSDQAFAIERDLEDRLFALKKGAIDKALALELDPARIAQLNAQKEDLEMQHQERLTQIAIAAERERTANSLAATAAVEQAFAGFLTDLAMGAKSVKDAFRSMVNSIAQAISQLAAKNIAQALFGPATAGGGMLTSLFGFLNGGGGGGGSLFGGLFGGGGGAGWVSAGGMDFPSFAVGTPYVPRDMVALIHQGEAVIPAEFNKAGRFGGGVTVSNHFAITGPVDRRTQDQIAVATQRAVMRATYRNA